MCGKMMTGGNAVVACSKPRSQKLLSLTKEILIIMADAVASNNCTSIRFLIKISGFLKFVFHPEYPLSYGVPVRERYGSTLLPATREQHDQNCTQSY